MKSSLHWYRQRQSSAIFFVAALILAVVGVIQKLFSDSVFLISASVVAAVGVGVTRLQQAAAKRDAQTAEMRKALIGVTGKGSLPLAKAVSYEGLGVLNFTDEIPYQERTVERKAAEILNNRKPLLIVGPGLSGKSRLAAELMKRTYPERQVLIPLSATSFQDFLKSLSSADRFVVWLDDFDRYLGDETFDRQFISKLAGNNAIIATMNEESFAGLRGYGTFQGYKASVLQCFEVVHLRNRSRENVRHSLSFECAEDSEIVKQYGIAGFAGGLPRVRQLLDTIRIADRRKFALVRTIYSWQQTGLNWIHQDNLISLLNNFQGKDHSPFSLSDIQDTITSLGSSPSMPRIIERTSDWLRVPSYVIDFFLHDDEGGVPAKIWEAALDVARVCELPMLGHLALAHYRNPGVAERAWQRAAEAGDGYSMWALGMMLEKSRNRRDEGIEWLQKACSAGYSDAYETLARALFRKKMRNEAIHWLNMATDKGNISAMIQLGHLFENEGAREDALWWYERAAKSGSSDADFKISQLLRRSGKRKEADKVLEQSRDPRAIQTLVMIGLDAYWRGEVEVAKGKFLRAAANRSVWALVELAYAHLIEGNIRAAAENYRQAADLGSCCGMTGLGYIARDFLEDNILAERWLRQASQYGCDWALYFLGVYYEESGNYKSAEFWYRGAAKRSNVEGMYQLGLMLESRFDYKDAAKWYRKAGELGHIVAANNLAAMRLSQGQDDEATRWSDRTDFLLAEAETYRVQLYPPPPCKRQLIC